MGSFRSGNRRSGGFSRDNRSGGSRFSGGSKRFEGGEKSGGFRGERSSGSGFRRERRGFGGGDREMHDAECSKCGKQCKIPFRPSGGKPVYCSDCFRSNGGSSSNGFSSQREERSSSVNIGGISQEQFKQLNTKLDKILNILEELEIDVVEDDGLNEVIDESSKDEDDDSEDEKEDK